MDNMWCVLNTKFENNFSIKVMDSLCYLLKPPQKRKLKILLCFIHITSFEIELRILGPLDLGTFASTYLEEFGFVRNIA